MKEFENLSSLVVFVFGAEAELCARRHGDRDTEKDAYPSGLAKF